MELCGCAAAGDARQTSTSTPDGTLRRIENPTALARTSGQSTYRRMRELFRENSERASCSRPLLETIGRPKGRHYERTTSSPGQRRGSLGRICSGRRCERPRNERDDGHRVRLHDRLAAKRLQEQDGEQRG